MNCTYINGKNIQKKFIEIFKWKGNRLHSGSIYFESFCVSYLHFLISTNRWKEIISLLIYSNLWSVNFLFIFQLFLVPAVWARNKHCDRLIKNEKSFRTFVWQILCTYLYVNDKWNLRILFIDCWSYRLIYRLNPIEAEKCVLHGKPFTFIFFSFQLSSFGLFRWRSYSSWSTMNIKRLNAK